MMRKLFVFTLFVFSSMTLWSQNLIIKMSSATVNKNDTVNINVTVDNFTDLEGAQFSVAWDSTKFKFAQFANKITNTVLPGDIDFGFPLAGTNVKQGQATFVWYNVNSVSLANGTRLFTLRLKATGALCDSSDLKTSNLPTKSEYYFNGNTFIPTNMPGKAKINGPGCTSGGGGGGDSTSLKFTAATVIAKPNSEICVPLTVDNFKNISALQTTFTWDPNVLTIKTPPKFTPLNMVLYNPNASQGSINILWTASQGAVTLPNGSKLFEFCFDVKGAVGSMSPIDIDASDLVTNFVDSFGNEIKNVKITDGKVTVQNIDPIILTIDKVTTMQNQNVEVTLKVDNFKDVLATGFAITYDNSILEFVSRSMDAEPTASHQVVGNNRINYLFNKLPPGLTLPNGSILTKLTFKALACNGADKVSAIEIKDQSNLIIEFINSAAVKLPYTINQGSVTVKCNTTTADPCNVTIASSTNVTCNGLNNGSINVNINKAEGCSVVWKKDGTVYGQTLTVANPNLTNLAPGVYTIEVCTGNQLCTTSATITQPSAINISGQITDVACGTLGSITTTTTGGSGGYQYLWNPGGMQTKDIFDIQAGTYTLVVTDNTNCTSSKAFEVKVINSSEDITLTPTVTNAKCSGDSNGSISLDIKGGCPTYDITWANSTDKSTSRSNLAAGTYGVTVTDKSNPSKTKSLQIVVGTPDPLTATNTITNSTGNDGGISITTFGGTQPYSYKWNDNTTVTTEDRTGLAPGNYTVTITDANGCTYTNQTPYQVIDISTPNADLKVSNFGLKSETINNGYGVSCVNTCDGVIGGTIADGKKPYTIAVTGVVNTTKTQNEPGAFTIGELCAGDYVVKVTDANGKSDTKSIKVTQPTAVNVTSTASDVKCANGAIPTGSIDITVNGGAGGYTYNWSNGKSTEDIELLSIGKYTVVVSDRNGCQSAAVDYFIKDCNATENCFESYTSIITPNGDGLNDVLNISCATEFDNQFLVYDRWGQLIFRSNNYNNLWDGVDSNGAPLPEGGYMWVMQVTRGDGSTTLEKGSVTILRN